MRAKELLEGWKDFDRVLYYQGLSYILKIIRSKLISQYYNNPSVGHFEVKTTWELIVRKYYQGVRYNNKDYVRGYDVCLRDQTYTL